MSGSSWLLVGLLHQLTISAAESKINSRSLPDLLSLGDDLKNSFKLFQIYGLCIDFLMLVNSVNIIKTIRNRDSDRKYLNEKGGGNMGTSKIG